MYFCYVVHQLTCVVSICLYCLLVFFFFQAEDGIRDLVRSRGLGDVYKRQVPQGPQHPAVEGELDHAAGVHVRVQPLVTRDAQDLSLIHI